MFVTTFAPVENITLLYTDIISKCRTLSSYDAREVNDQTGASLYDKFVLTSQEDDLIKMYADEGIELMEANLGRYIVNSVNSVSSNVKTGKVWTLDECVGTSVKKLDSIKTAVMEAICSWCMMRWLTGKDDNRAMSYKIPMDTMIEVVKNDLLVANKPIKERRVIASQEVIVDD